MYCCQGFTRENGRAWRFILEFEHLGGDMHDLRRGEHTRESVRRAEQHRIKQRPMLALGRHQICSMDELASALAGGRLMRRHHDVSINAWRAFSDWQHAREVIKDGFGPNVDDRQLLATVMCMVRNVREIGEQVMRDVEHLLPEPTRLEQLWHEFEFHAARDDDPDLWCDEHGYGRCEGDTCGMLEDVPEPWLDLGGEAG